MQDQVRTVRVVIDSSGALAGARQYNGALDSMEARSRAAIASNDNHAASTSRLVQQITGASQANTSLGRSLDTVRSGTSAANENVKTFTGSIEQSHGSLKTMIGHLGNATLAVAGLGFALGGIHALIHSFVELSDESTEVTSRLLAFTNSSQELAQAQAMVVEVANKTRSGLPEIAELFQKIGIQADHLHLSLGQVGVATTVFAETLKLSGSTTNQQKAAMLQLGEAFDIGQLNGRHFIAMMQDNIVFMRLLATSMGVPIGALKEMSKEGKVTAEAIKKALTDPEMVAKIEERFGRLPVSFAQVRTGIHNTLIQLAGDFAEGAGLNTSLAVLYANIAKLGTDLKPTFEKIGVAFRAAINTFAPTIQAAIAAIKPVFSFVLTNAPAIIKLLKVGAEAWTAYAVGMLAVKAVGLASTLATELQFLGLVVKEVITGASAFSELAKALKATAVAQAVFNAVAALNPYVIVGAAIVGVIALLYEFSDAINLGGGTMASLGDLFRAIWADIKETVSIAITGIQDGFVSLWDGIKTGVANVGDFLGDAFSLPLKEIGDLWNSAFGDLDLSLAGILVGAARTLDALVGLFRGTMRAIVSLWGDLPAALGPNFMFIFNLARDALADFGKTAASVFSGMVSFVNAFVALVVAALNDASKTFTAWGNGAIGLINKVISGANALGAGVKPLAEMVAPKITAPKVDATFQTAGHRAAAAFASGFGHEAENGIKGVIAQADAIGKQRKKAEGTKPPVTPTPPGSDGEGSGGDKGKKDKDAERRAKAEKEFWQTLQDELDSAKLYGEKLAEFTKEKELHKILDRDLTDSEKQRVDNAVRQITNEKAITDLKKSAFELNNKTSVEQARQLGITAEQGKIQDALDAKTVAALNEGADIKSKGFQDALADYKVALERNAAQEKLNELLKTGLETAKKYAPAFALSGELQAMQKELDGFLKAYGTGNLKDAWGKPMSEVTRDAVVAGIKGAMALKPLEAISSYTGDGTQAAQDVAILKANQAHDAALAVINSNPVLDPTTRDKYLKDVADKYKTEMDKASTIVADAAAAKLKKVFDDLGDVLSKIGSAIGGKAGAAVGAAGDATKAYGAFADTSKKTSDAITQAFDPNGKSPLIAGIGKAVGGAVAGLEIGDKIGQLGAALGLKGGETGAKIGGAIGGAAFGPIGSILGALGGGLISSLFYKPPSSSVGFTNDANGNVVAGNVSGSNAQLKKATSGAASDVINGLASLASSLGGKLTGAPNLEIGTFNDKWRVNDSATSKSLNYNNFNDSTLHNFDDDEAAAVKYAIGKALTQGVITGLSDLAQKAIKALDQDSAVTLVQNWSSAMKDFAALTDPVTAAVQDITTPLQQLRDSMVAVGASTADLTKLDQYRALKLAEVLKQQTSSIRGFLDDLKGDAGGVSKLSQLTTQMNLLKGFDADILAGKTIDQDAFQNALTKATSLNGDIYGTNTSAFQDNVSQFSQFGNDLLNSITNAFNNAAGGDATTAAVKAQTDQVTATIGIGNDLQSQTNAKLDKVIDLLATGTLTIAGSANGKQAVSY